LSNIEKDITEHLKQGNVKAIELLYDHYAENLYGVVFQILGNEEQAQDVLQESLVKVWQQAQSYDPSKGRLFTWVLTICKRKAIDVLRKQNRRSEIQGEASDVYLRKISGDNKAAGQDHDVKKFWQA
jgi:RNA polymerase sigma-70 factor (ECF subfamily)